MNEAAVLELLKRFGKAFNAGDADAILACVTADFEWRMADGRIARGRDEVARALAERDGEIESLRFSDAQVFIAGDRVVGTFRATGRRRSGAGVDVRGCDLYVVRDGLIARKDTYWKDNREDGGEDGA